MAHLSRDGMLKHGNLITYNYTDGSQKRNLRFEKAECVHVRAGGTHVDEVSALEKTMVLRFAAKAMAVDGVTIYGELRSERQTAVEPSVHEEAPVPVPVEEEETEYTLESSYIHDHLKSVADGIIAELGEDNTSIVYKLYKEISEDTIENPTIVVKDISNSDDIASYDTNNDQITVQQAHLVNIEEDNDKKIELISALANAYGEYINYKLENKQNQESIEDYEYTLFRFDGIKQEMLTIAKLISPTYNGYLKLDFSNKQASPKSKWEKSGPGASIFEIKSYDTKTMELNASNSSAFALKFGYSVKEGFTANPYIGISEELEEANDLHIISGDSKKGLWLTANPTGKFFSPNLEKMSNPLIISNVVSPQGPPIKGIFQFSDDTGLYLWSSELDTYEHYSPENGSFTGYYSADEFALPVGEYSISFSPIGVPNEEFNKKHSIDDLAVPLMLYLMAKGEIIELTNQDKYPGVKIYSSEYMNGAVTLGNIIFTNPSMQDIETLAHEYGHFLDFKHHFKYNKKEYINVIGFQSIMSATKATLDASIKHHNSQSEMRADILGGAYHNINLYTPKL